MKIYHQNRVQGWTLFCLIGFVGISLLCDNYFIVVQALDDVCTKDKVGECRSNPTNSSDDSSDSNSNSKRNSNSNSSSSSNNNSNDIDDYLYQRLAPSDLPPPQIFDSFDGSTRFSISGRELTAMHGKILQQGHISTDGESNSDSDNNDESGLVVIPGLIPRPVVAEILALLRGHENADKAGGKTTIQLDSDPDSVDGMTSQEMFLDNDSLRNGGASKGNSFERENMEEREGLRQKLRALTDEYAYNILTPLLQEFYGEEKCGREGRQCTVCYSLIRRYRAGERQSHAPHNDSHSFVTVVVSLTDYGDEYNGGLYVSTKSSERNYVKLNRGDAVAHQGDLHHGVRVLDYRDDGGPSERWSWIMWFRDSDTCSDHGAEWFRDCAYEGNPTCMYLHASSDGNQIKWNTKASDAGHAQASVKMAYAYLKHLNSHLQYDRRRARNLFAKAIASSNEPDGHYGMALILLTNIKEYILNQPGSEKKQMAAVKMKGSTEVLKAIGHLEEAAKGGHPFAMFNLGLCHTYGYGDEIDYELATQWFEASGLPEGLFAKSMYLGSVGRKEESLDFRERAKILGFGTMWRTTARERTGNGGSPGPKLNLPWPPLPGNVVPPEW